MNKNKKILMTDRSWPLMLEVIEDLSRLCKKDGINILFLSERHKSSVKDNLEIINIFDIPQKKSMSNLQSEYNFSLYKCLVTERSYCDYSSFKSSQLYSRINFSKIEQWMQLYTNAFDYIANTKNVDVLIENAPDCFIPSLGGRIFKSKKIQYYSIHISYWHSDGILFFDGTDWTSSRINDIYKDCIAGNVRYDINQLDEIFKTKKTLFWNRMPQHMIRIKTILNRFRSYNRPSLINWFLRRISTMASKYRIITLIKRSNKIGDEKFVLYPLHVSPEASLLGTVPELADQFSVLKNISMNLPWGIKLYVKEHPHSLLGAGLDYTFYKKLQTLRNVVIIHKEMKISDLIESEKFVCLIGLSGTACLEVALKRKFSIIIGNPYFKIADCFIKVSNYEEINDEIKKIINNEKVFNENSLYSILHAIDECVIKENVDFRSCKTTLAIAMSYNPIIRKFVMCL
jgi:hypothetical protein